MVAQYTSFVTTMNEWQMNGKGTTRQVVRLFFPSKADTDWAVHLYPHKESLTSGALGAYVLLRDFRDPGSVGDSEIMPAPRGDVISRVCGDYQQLRGGPPPST